MVRAMESMNIESQMRFADKMLELSEALLQACGGQDYIISLDPKRREGLDKSKARNRWYDRYESLHQAFNNLYALSSGDRRTLAMQLHTPIQIVEAYERYCKQADQSPDQRVVEEILRTSLREGPERARRLYAIYLSDFSEEIARLGRSSTESTWTEDNFWSLVLRSLQQVLQPAR